MRVCLQGDMGADAIGDVEGALVIRTVDAYRGFVPTVDDVSPASRWSVLEEIRMTGTSIHAMQRSIVQLAYIGHHDRPIQNGQDGCHPPPRQIQLEPRRAFRLDAPPYEWAPKSRNLPLTLAQIR